MSYPNIEDPDFQKKIANKFKHYKLKTVPTFKELCFPKEFKLQESQQFVSKIINPSSPYKSLLVFHKIGAGKTCAAIRIAEEWKQKKIL